MEEILQREIPTELKALFEFNKTNTVEEIRVKFNIFSRYFYPEFFKRKDAPFHKEIDTNLIRLYKGDIKRFVDIAFRGAAKTTRTKLFVTYVIANDTDHYRRYIKVLSADASNAKQIVTDVYNLLINERVQAIYPEIFEKTREKREETMQSFTTATGVKMQADSVGTDQRGDIQQDARPDFIWADDFETRKTLRSAVITQAIYDNLEEALNGLSKEGSALFNCNYLSERGNVHRLLEKKADNKVIMITPIKKDNKPTWDAYTIEEINNIEKNAEDFAGEYMCEPSAGADIYFDRATLDNMPKRTPVRVIADFKIFYPYEFAHRYGLGADVGGGVGLDSSTTVIIDFTTFPSRVVATFKNNVIKPDSFGDEIASQGNRYGECIVAPENNSFGYATIARLKQVYNNIYFTEAKETRAGLPPSSRTYGWNTNLDTKSKMLGDLKTAVSNGHLELSDPDLIAELRSYSRDDLMDKDIDPRLTTRHFDLLISCAIAYAMRNHAEISKNEKPIYEQPAYERSGLES